MKRLAAGLYLTTAFDAPRVINLPDDYLTPVLRCAKECKRYTIYASDVTHYLLAPKTDSDMSVVKDYIAEAEMIGISKRPFFRGRNDWYDIGDPPRSHIVVPEIIYRRYFFAWNADRCALNKNFYGIETNLDEAMLFSLLNFTFSFLYFELSGRKLGAGASGISVRVANQLPVVAPEYLDVRHRTAVINAAESMRERAILDLNAELYQSDRQALDRALLDLLGLSRAAQDDLYARLIDLVGTRISKANLSE